MARCSCILHSPLDLHVILERTSALQHVMFLIEAPIRHILSLRERSEVCLEER